MRSIRKISLLAIVLTTLLICCSFYVISSDGDSTNNDVTIKHSDDDHDGDSDHESEGQKGKGKNDGEKGKGNGRHGIKLTDEDSDHEGKKGQGKSNDRGGGPPEGKGNGGSGGKKGGGGVPDNPGAVTLNVEVKFVDEEGTTIDFEDEVYVNLIREYEEVREGAPDSIPDWKLGVRTETTDHVATFLSEASGDCVIVGEPIPGFEIAWKKIMLTGDAKETTETLTYVQTDIPVSGISVNPEKLRIIKDYLNSATLTAVVEPLNASNQGVTWSTSDSDIIELQNITVKEVIISGKIAGTSDVTATTVEGNYSDTCTVNVVTIDSIESLETINALKGQLVMLPETVTANLSDGETFDLGIVNWSNNEGLSMTEDYTFKVPLNPTESSENPPIISYTFTGELDGFAGTVDLTVSVDYNQPPANPVTDIDLTPEIISQLIINKEAELTATLKTQNPEFLPTTPDVIWTSSNEDVITIKETTPVTDEQTNIAKNIATIKAVSAGNAIITVTTVDGSHQAYCQVGVTVEPEVELIFTERLVEGTQNTYETPDHYNTKEEILINVENMEITEPTTYHIKVEQKDMLEPILGTGTVTLHPGDKRFNLYDVTGFETASHYSNLYYAYISEEPDFPKDDEQTPMTNFHIGVATPTVPEDYLQITAEMIGGDRSSDNLKILFCRILDEDNIAGTEWYHYIDGYDDTDDKMAAFKDDPYSAQNIYFEEDRYKFDFRGETYEFVDEVKMYGYVENGSVTWIEPRETLKLGGYLLLEVVPKGYITNLNLANPESEEGELLKEVHLWRLEDEEVFDPDEIIRRHIINTYIGD